MTKDIAKPHITKLPIVLYPDQHITTNKVAVSIPIFHSDIDSGTMTEFCPDRIRDIHAKAAVWAAIALHNNTDLTQNGVGIFFHVEDTIHDIVAEMFTKFAVPSNFIRTMTLPKTETQISHPHYGKKLMCLDDTEIAPDAWLIVDTDAFICSSQHRLTWYHKLLSQTHPSTIQAETVGGTAYNMWVYGVCLAVGLPFDPEADLFMQEQRAFYKLGFDYLSHDTPENQRQRPFIASQLTFIPTAHPICDFLRQHYRNCYQDEFLLAMWHLKHNDITPLDDVPLYYKATDYIHRDKSLDTDGYLLHISGNTEDTDQYFPDFYDALHHSPFPVRATSRSRYDDPSSVGATSRSRYDDPSSVGATSRSRCQTDNRDQEVAPTEENITPPKFRFHLLGIAYGTTRKDFSACAFVQKTRKGSNMLHKLGHEVYHYGHENSDLNCTEHITVIDDFVLQKTYGTTDHNGAPDGYTVDDLAFTTFDINTERELRKRIQPGDFILASFPHKKIYQNIADLPVHFVEWGIGYPHTYAAYRVYESNGWMHFHRGVEHATDIKSYNEPDWCCAVIPNYFDPDEFEYRTDKEDYLLFLGRVDRCKGIEIALETSKQTGIPLVIAGQNFLGDELYQMMHRDVEYVGVVGSDDRRELLSKAMAVICPSMYLEPFLGVHIEAGFCGTPIITTNWGAPVEYCKHGITGYRCHSGEQFLWAVENIDRIDPQACLNWTTHNFSMDRISLSYHEYFQTLHRNINGYFWDRNANRTHLNWLRTDMTEPDIAASLLEVQSCRSG